MPKHRTKHGAAPKTKGWDDLASWVRKNNANKLAVRLGVNAPLVHSWFWRDSRPSADMRPVVCAVIGGEPTDWDTAEEKKLRKARALRISKLKAGEQEQREAS